MKANNLRPGTWYEIRVVARSAAGDTAALYRAATHTADGARGRTGGAAGAGAGAGASAAWSASLAPLMLAAGLAALLAAVAGSLTKDVHIARYIRGPCAAGVAAARRRAAACARARSPPPPRALPQLYTTEPGKRNGKALTPPEGDLHEISPYATFSMAGGCTGAGAGASAGAGAGAGAGGCALHLRTFGRAESLDLAAPPPRPNLLAHGNDYGRARDSDSESSGSPCAACAAELYRMPASRLSAVESSAEDTSYSASGRIACASRVGRGGTGDRSERSERGERERAERGRQQRGRRRRDHSRHSSAPTVLRHGCAAAAAPGSAVSKPSDPSGPSGPSAVSAVNAARD
ncbi:unnamed protein product [Diatraea saccharalis]|uniref:Fibronectin type-III domain-containing protein n=1 Tax=Diatraea saccharalis TaxID=40085 RepID=A0A9N9RG32_9NEOP|nr:unnamed protein product [Diatraea saccharalis]